MNEDLVKHFIEAFTKGFEFLVTDHNFADPTIEVDRKYRIVLIRYLGRNLAIQFAWEERDEDISCSIIRLSADGKVPAWSDNPQVRTRLFSLLTRRAPSEQLVLHQLGHLSIREQISTAVMNYKHMLTRYGADILADSPDALT